MNLTIEEMLYLSTIGMVAEINDGKVTGVYFEK